MNIPINKDINEEYKSDLWKGFTGRQLLFISIALCCGTGMILLCYGVIHIPIKMCIRDRFQLGLKQKYIHNYLTLPAYLH